MEAKRFEIYNTTSVGPSRFEALDSPFKCDLPLERIGYSALAPYHLPGHWGSAGFNAEGVGMSATESIFSNEKALAADPFVSEGLAENSVGVLRIANREVRHGGKLWYRLYRLQ